MNGLFEGMFGKIAPGMCRLSMNGEIAVKTDTGYKSFHVKTGRLTNCDQFVFNIGEEFFFLVPTNKVSVGDIILVNGKPRCVVDSTKTRITVINYEDSTIEQVVPEHHFFMGNSYLYGKIVSMFGNKGLKSGKGPGKIMKFMMMNEMMKGMGQGNQNGSMNAMLPLMMMGNGGLNGFEDLFDLDLDEESDQEDEDTEIE